MPKINPCLWFDGNAEEAARFYVSVFPNSKLGRIAYYPKGAPMPEGAVMTVEFELDGFPVTALNAGPEFHFSEAVSFQVECDDQAEIDRYWTALLAGGGQESVCGWLKDRFGFSWQVFPRRLIELNTDPDRAKAARAMAAMMKMVKIDLAAIEAAAAG